MEAQPSLLFAGIVLHETKLVVRPVCTLDSRLIHRKPAHRTILCVVGIKRDKQSRVMTRVEVVREEVMPWGGSWVLIVLRMLFTSE